MINIEEKAREVKAEYDAGMHPKGIDDECFARYIKDEYIKQFQEGICPFCESKIGNIESFHVSFGRGQVPDGSSTGYKRCISEKCRFGIGYVYVNGKEYRVSRKQIDSRFFVEENVPLINMFAEGNITTNESEIIRNAMKQHFSDICMGSGYII